MLVVEFLWVVLYDDVMLWFMCLCVCVCLCCEDVCWCVCLCW